MARPWRERVTVGRGDVAAAALIALLASTWFLASTPAPGAGNPTQPGSGRQSALIADASLTPAALPDSDPNATLGPDSTPGLDPTPGPDVSPPKSPSAGPTAGSSQSQPPSPSNGAAPTPTPGEKSPPTPALLPDLQVTAYGVGDGKVLCGADNTGYVTIGNAGQGPAPKGIAVLFLLLENGKPTWTVTQTIEVDMAPGKFYTLRAVFRPAEPCAVDLLRSWSVSIDPSKAVAESREDNNFASISWESATR